MALSFWDYIVCIVFSPNRRLTAQSLYRSIRRHAPHLSFHQSIKRTSQRSIPIALSIYLAHSPHVYQSRYQSLDLSLGCAAPNSLSLYLSRVHALSAYLSIRLSDYPSIAGRSGRARLSDGLGVLPTNSVGDSNSKIVEKKILTKSNIYVVMKYLFLSNSRSKLQNPRKKNLDKKYNIWCNEIFTQNYDEKKILTKDKKYVYARVSL